MAAEIITKEDLQAFKTELLNELRHLLIPAQARRKEWLRGSEVRKLLKISYGTLQNLRITGKLRLRCLFFKQRRFCFKARELSIQ